MKIIDYSKQSGKAFLIKVGKGVTKSIEISKILYFKSDKDYTCIYFIENKTIISCNARKTLRDYESELEKFSFQRINRSIIINLQYLHSMKGKFLYLKRIDNTTEIQLKITEKYKGFFKC
jgi:DNA-binding LytR/AlgR family response regulator